MPNLPKHLTALFSALSFRNWRPGLLRALTDSEWKRLLNTGETHRLLVPLRQRFDPEIPEWARVQIDASLADNALRFQRIMAAYQQFAQGMADIAADHVVIKGFAQCPDFVDNPRFRLQSDIDVYCPPDSIFAARDVLVGLGYEPIRGVDFGLADHLPTMALKTPWVWRGNFCDPEIPASFELHFCFWNEALSKLPAGGVEQFWSRRIVRRLEGVNLPTLCDIDNLGYTALNLTRNLLRDGASPYQVYELAKFLHKNANDEAFWKSWQASHDDSVRLLEIIACGMASQCFDCRLADTLENELDRLPVAVKAWLETFKDVPLAQQYRPNKDGLWLHLALLQSSAHKLSILKQRIFPTQPPLLERVELLQRAENPLVEKLSPVRRYGKYLQLVSSRVVHHGRLVPSTIWRGLQCWWAAAGLGRNFVNFLGISFLYTLGMYIFFFLYNLYLLDLGLRENFIGMVTGAMTLGGVAGTLPAGVLTQRLGIRNSLVICASLVSILSTLRCLAAPPGIILALAFLTGFVSVIWAVTVPPAIAQLTNGKNRPLGFSIAFFFGIAVGVLGARLGGELPGWLAHLNSHLNAATSKRFTLIIASAIVGLTVVPISRLQFACTPARERRVYCLSPFLLRFLTAIAIWGLAMGAIAPFFSVYFSRYLQMPLKRIGIVDAASRFPQLFALFVAPAVFRKFGLVKGIVFAQVATATALAFLASPAGKSAAVGIYMCYVTFQWVSEPGLYSLLMDRVPAAERTGASALNFLVLNSVQAIAAFVAGASFLRFGYPVVIGVTAVLALFAAFVFQLLPASDRLRSSAPSPSNSYGD